MRLSLYQIQVPRSRTRVRTNKLAADLRLPNPFPQKSISGLQCPVCLGKEDGHPLFRQYEYARKDTLIRHFASHELHRLLQWS